MKYITLLGPCILIAQCLSPVGKLFYTTARNVCPSWGMGGVFIHTLSQTHYFPKTIIITIIVEHMLKQHCTPSHFRIMSQVLIDLGLLLYKNEINNNNLYSYFFLPLQYSENVEFQKNYIHTPPTHKRFLFCTLPSSQEIPVYFHTLLLKI